MATPLGELRIRFAFAALMIAVGLAPVLFVVARTLRPASPGITVHPSAVIETSLLLVGGVVLAATTALEARRGAREVGKAPADAD